MVFGNFRADGRESIIGENQKERQVQRDKEIRKTVSRVVLAAAIILVVPVIFEKYTFYRYVTANPDFFTYSGSRLWVDIIWFVVSGVISALIVGRERRASILPPLIASLLFIVSANVPPFCDVKECYVSSPDGLTPLRDFLLLGSLGVITSAASMKHWYDDESKNNKVDTFFQLSIVTLVGFALSFFPVTHIFAGVSVPYPLNYVQWFLAGAPASLAASMLILDRGNLTSDLSKIFSGLLGVLFALILSISLPCPDCIDYPTSIASILLLATLFTLPAVLLGRKIAKLRKKSVIQLSRIYRKTPNAVAVASIAISIIAMMLFYIVPSYQASVVNSFAGAANSSFSPLEVGRTFVYSAGYLAIPRVTSKAVGVNVSFGNTVINQSAFPNDFIAAGVGDQSPNCCKDGLDLAYRADNIQFSNGSEALVARAWWACDTNMACGGYSWQELLHFGIKDVPSGTFANWVGLEMNWTSSSTIEWYYRITYTNNHSSTGWTLFSSFTPPKIQNHYWDAGLLYVGLGNLPTGYAYFYQFGVSSAYPITDGSWHVFMQCPEIVLNGSWNCLPKAGFVTGLHSFWKVIYTFGESYPGIDFSYLGNHEVEFFYSGRILSDGTMIW